MVTVTRKIQNQAKEEIQGNKDSELIFSLSNFSSQTKCPDPGKSEEPV